MENSNEPTPKYTGLGRGEWAIIALLFVILLVGVVVLFGPHFLDNPNTMYDGM